MMKFARHSFVVLATTVAIACGKSPAEPAPAKFTGHWGRENTALLPPVNLEVRTGPTGYVGQVWLSGTTFTLPATFDDSSVVLANPASSQLAPFVAVMISKDVLRATLRSANQPDIVVQLYRRFEQ